jgi:hypothetical protein
MTTQEIINQNITELFSRCRTHVQPNVGDCGRCHWRIDLIDFDGSTKTQIFRLPGLEYLGTKENNYQDPTTSEIISILESRIKTEEQK